MKCTKSTVGVLNEKDIIAYNVKCENGFEFELLNLGGAITKIKVPDKDGNVENIVLAYSNIEDYISNPYYYGGIIGRTSGRICNAEVMIEDKLYNLNKNYDMHQGHGGNVGFSHKIWDVEVKEEIDNVTLILKLKSYDGEENYPGNLDIKVSFKIYNNYEFEEIYEVFTDKTTLVNMTNHSYFNLSGDIKRPITDQCLQIDSKSILELDETCVPTGKILEVDNTSFDFRNAKCIGKDIKSDDEQINIGNGYDHAFLLDDDKKIYMYDEESRRTMSITTDQKCAVVYSMNWEHDLLLYTGSKPPIRYAICFETQAPPIGRNMCFLDESILNENEKYIQK
ncbi:MAG: aldose epimerase family protein, partial [Peptostreptococcaceae bacterium]